MFKLQVGDIIEVSGFCWLDKLESGKYRISKIEKKYKLFIYSFTKPKGKKVIVRHWSNAVDLWIKDSSDSDLNKIVKIV